MLRILVAAWVAWAAILVLAQRRMLFPGRSAPPLAAGDTLSGARLHRLTVPGAEVEAWWLPPVGAAPGPAPAVLFTHGNAELVDEWVSSFGPLQAAGAGVLLLEYPGYGRSTGIATEATVTAATEAAFDLLASLSDEVDPARIVAFGRSVGGGPAAALSRRRPVAALVLSSSFTGVRAYAARYLVPPLLVRHRFDNLEAVRAFEGPVLILHGRLDRTVPFRHGERLAAAAREASFVPYECGHNDCPWSSMLDEVVDFLRRRGVLRPH